MHRDRDTADPADDDIRAEALLTYERAALSAQEISAAFGWDLPRTRHAIRQLQGRLVNGGTRLRDAGHGRWRITPHHSVVSTTDRERLAQTRLRKKGLTTTEALVLRKVAAGPVHRTSDSRAKRQELMATEGLLEMGLVTTDKCGATVIAPMVKRSLHLGQ